MEPAGLLRQPAGDDSSVDTATDSGETPGRAVRDRCHNDDLFLPTHRADPYTPARKLREAGPVHRTPLGLHLLTRYAECASVLQSNDWSHADEAGQLHPSVSAEEAAEELPTSFLWMDPPDHTRLRTLVSKAFTPRTVAALRPRIEQLAGELVDAALEAGEFDLIDLIAYPLPLTVVCELVGVPAADQGGAAVVAGPGARLRPGCPDDAGGARRAEHRVA